MGFSRLGYGSHSFLNKFIRRNSCSKIMEIGVADGENAKNMVEAASRKNSPGEVEYYGFDKFGGKDNFQIRQVRRKLEKTGCKYKLFKGDSVNTLPQMVRTLPMMDLIFIDGGHSYPTVKSDWENSKSLMHSGTAVFFHNYNFSGPRKVVDNISREEYQVKIINPPSDCETAVVKKRI